MPFGIGAIYENTGFYVLDLETTGIKPEEDRIVEIAIVHVTPDNKIDREWTTLVNPGMDVGPTHVHGITNEMVKDAPTFAEIGPYVLNMIAGAPVVAHNASFDVPLLMAELVRNGLHTFGDPLPRIDTIDLAKKYLTLPNYRLGTICHLLHIDLEHAHCALDDTRATAEVFMHFRREDPALEFPQTLDAENMVWDVPDEIVEPKVVLRPQA